MTHMGELCVFEKDGRTFDKLMPLCKAPASESMSNNIDEVDCPECNRIIDWAVKQIVAKEIE